MSYKLKSKRQIKVVMYEVNKITIAGVDKVGKEERRTSPGRGNDKEN